MATAVIVDQLTGSSHENIAKMVVDASTGIDGLIPRGALDGKDQTVVTPGDRAACSARGKMLRITDIL